MDRWEEGEREGGFIDGILGVGGVGGGGWGVTPGKNSVLCLPAPKTAKLQHKDTHKSFDLCFKHRASKSFSFATLIHTESAQMRARPMRSVQKRAKNTFVLIS